MSFEFAGAYGPATANNAEGLPLAAVPFTVYNVGTTQLASLFTDRTMATAAANPVNSDASGNLTFFAVPGRYDVVGNGEKLTVYVYPDPAESGNPSPGPGGVGLVESVFGSISVVNGTGPTVNIEVAGGPFRPVFNVVAYGAQSNNLLFDSAPGIQAAIAACGAAGGGIVYFPPGIYSIVETLVVGNATAFNTTTAGGTSGTTLNVSSTAAFPASGKVSVFTAELTATVVTYTGKTSNSFTGCSSLSGLTATNLLVTGGTISTVNNIVLMGPALNASGPFGFTGYGDPAATLYWAGASNGTMINWKGPMTGGGISNLYLDGHSNLAGTGVKVNAANCAVFENVFVHQYNQQGWDITGVTGFPGPFGTIIGITTGCTFRSLGGDSGVSNSKFIVLDGDTTHSAIGSANTTYSVFDHLYFSLGDPGSGNSIYGIYHRFCDNISIRNVVMICPSSPVGTIYAAVYDYSAVSNCPLSCIIDGINPGLTTGEWLAVGSQVGGDKNRVLNIVGGGTQPTLSGVTFVPIAAAG